MVSVGRAVETEREVDYVNYILRIELMDLSDGLGRV